MELPTRNFSFSSFHLIRVCLAGRIYRTCVKKKTLNERSERESRIRLYNTSRLRASFTYHIGFIAA